MAGQQDIGALVVTLEAQTAAFEKGMQQATNEIKKFGGAASAVEQQLGGIQGAFLKFNVATTAISTGMNMVASAFAKLRSFAEVRESLDNVQASFTAVLGSGNRAADMMMRVKRISNELGTGIPQTANAVRRMAIGLNQLGSTNAEIEKVTTTFLKIGAIGGSIEEATAAIFQFSQALGSGTLRGDELISLLERQPLIAQEIAKYLQKIGLSADGTIGSLRKLASEGKVTSTILKDAMIDAEARIAEQYKSMPIRISQALNKITNQLNEFYYEVNKKLKINEGISDFLEKIPGLISGPLKNLGLFFDDLSKNMWVLQVATIAVAAAFAGPLVAALNAARIASLAFIATPVGAVLAALGLAIAGVMAYWKELRDTILQLGIGFLQLGGIIKKAFGGDDSNIQSMIIDLEAARMETVELGKATTEAEEATKKLSDAQRAAAEYAKKFGEAVKKSMESFRESIFGARVELATIPEKMKELERLMSTEKNPVMLEKLKDMYKKLKEELDPVDAALRKAAEATQNATNPMNALAKELESLDKQLAAGYISWDTYGIAVEQALDKIQPKKLEESKTALDEIGVAIGTTLSNSVSDLTDVLFEADATFMKFAENFLKQIAKMIVQMMLLKAIKTSLGGTSFGDFLGFKANAAGDSYEGGTGLKQGVYDKPTFFAFANGGTFGGRNRLGVMGEAGPEAILPLKRGANGQLGVQAGNMASSETVVNVYNSADAVVKTSETTNQDGSKTIDIMIEKKVKELFGTGAMDKSMRASYGLVRSAA
jgi:lambda family phage tail tape measure protein